MSDESSSSTPSAPKPQIGDTRPAPPPPPPTVRLPGERPAGERQQRPQNQRNQNRKPSGQQQRLAELLGAVPFAGGGRLLIEVERLHLVAREMHPRKPVPWTIFVDTLRHPCRIAFGVQTGATNCQAWSLSPSRYASCGASARVTGAPVRAGRQAPRGRWRAGTG